MHVVNLAGDVRFVLFEQDGPRDARVVKGMIAQHYAHSVWFVILIASTLHARVTLFALLWRRN